MMSKKRLAYLGGIYSIGSLFENSLAFFFIPIYTAYLGTTDYGIIGLMSVAVGLMSKLIAPPVISGFSRHYHAPEYMEKKGLVLFNSFLFLVAGALFLAIVLYQAKGSVSAIVLDDPALEHIVETYAAILFFLPLSEFMLALLRLEERAGLFVGISWLALIYGQLAGLGFTVLCVFPVLWRRCVPRLSLMVLAPLLRYGYPMILQGFAVLLIQSGDRYVLRMFSSVAVVGLYSFGYKFAGVMNIVMVAPLKYALQPIVLKQEATPARLRAFVSTSCTYCYLAGTLLWLAVTLFGKDALNLMARSAEFRKAWVVVPIIAFCLLQHGMGNFFNWGLTMAKKPYHISVNVAIAAGVNIALNFVLVPVLGIIGAAVATLISYVIWNGLKIHYSAKFYDLHFEIGRILHITLIGLSLYALSMVAASTASSLLNILVRIVIILAYLPVCFLTGFFSVEEKAYFREFAELVRRCGLKQAIVKHQGL
ncbi:MAG: polysaccharide biosynthesis C-terminal domain-containing protein [Deltaproteobacteria bacterium]|nr:polysaccharide biosynthesis C-terminal domain-containing protein [Deltaproteobacteria bacterium]